MHHRSAHARLHSFPSVPAIDSTTIPTSSAPNPIMQAAKAPPLADPRHSRTHLPASPESPEERRFASGQHAAEAFHTRPRAGAAAIQPSGPPARALRPAPRPLQASGPPQSADSRCTRPYHPPPGSVEGLSPIGALSASPASPETVPLAGISILAVIGVDYFFLSRSSSSMAVGLSLWIDLQRDPIRAV